jgi:hypothetical protein
MGWREGSLPVIDNRQSSHRKGPGMTRVLFVEGVIMTQPNTFCLAKKAPRGAFSFKW